MLYGVGQKLVYDQPHGKGLVVGDLHLLQVQGRLDRAADPPVGAQERGHQLFHIRFHVQRGYAAGAVELLVHQGQGADPVLGIRQRLCHPCVFRSGRLHAQQRDDDLQVVLGPVGQLPQEHVLFFQQRLQLSSERLRSVMSRKDKHHACRFAALALDGGSAVCSTGFPSRPS